VAAIQWAADRMETGEEARFGRLVTSG
jgi:hypothetical protein